MGSYVPNTEEERKAMLHEIGFSSIDDLFIHIPDEVKVKEEIGEFQEEVANMDKDKAEAEFGDVMFSLINAARLYKINPDNALERTNQKFIRRFNYLEEHTIKEGKNLKDMSLEEMDAIWNEAKKKGL